MGHARLVRDESRHAARLVVARPDARLTGDRAAAFHAVREVVEAAMTRPADRADRERQRPGAGPLPSDYEGGDA